MNERDTILSTLTDWEVARYADLGGHVPPRRLAAALESLAAKPQPEQPVNPFIGAFATNALKVSRSHAGVAVETPRGRKPVARRGPALPPPVPGEGEKPCRKCGRRRRFSLFHRDGCRPDGRSDHCIPCRYYVRIRAVSPDWQAA